MGTTEESTRRSARVLAAFMSQDDAAAFANTYAVDVPAFEAAWKARGGARAAVAEGYTPPRIASMPTSAAPHLRQLLSSPVFARFQGYEVKMVELGRLIVFQHWVDADAAMGVHGEGSTAAPGEDEILRRCLPVEVVPPATMTWMQTATTVTVCSMNSSLRFFGPRIDHANGQITFTVGPEPNLMIVREHAGRYVLANGNHRAWWLRSRGITMAPALVLHHPSPEQVAQGGTIRKEVLFGERPPLVDHFFDDHLAASVDVRSIVKVVKLTADVSFIPRLI